VLRVISEYKQECGDLFCELKTNTEVNDHTTYTRTHSDMPL